MAIKWNDTNNALLDYLWNGGKDDKEIAACFAAKEMYTGVYAIAKQRSNLGLVKVKHKEGIKRAPRRVLEVNSKPFFAIYYRKDGQNHFSFLDTNSEPKAIDIARNMIYNQRLHDVTILQPTTQLVCETIKTIKL